MQKKTLPFPRQDIAQAGVAWSCSPKEAHGSLRAEVSHGSQWLLFLLQLVTKEDPRALAVALSWDVEKTETVQQACHQELSLRLQQVQSLRSLRSMSTRKSSPPGEPREPKRAKQEPA